MSMASPLLPYTENNHSHSVLTRVKGEATFFRSFSLPMNSSILSAMACSIAYHGQMITPDWYHTSCPTLTPVSCALTSTLEWEHGTHTSQWATAVNLRYINSAGAGIGLIFPLIQPVTPLHGNSLFLAYKGICHHIYIPIHSHTGHIIKNTFLKIQNLVMPL